MSLEFTNLMDQQEVEQHNQQAVRIFTDGSRIGDRVGAALSLWNGEAEIKSLKLKLPSYCTVYQAELYAICRATREIIKRHEASYGIYSDSRAALETVTNHGSVHPLATETRQNLETITLQNKDISLFWIKAHAGMNGNERADELAKDAALNLKKKPDYDACPVSYVKRQIRKDSLDVWNRRYKSEDKAAVTKLFFPDAIEAHQIIKKMEISSVLTQVLTGHGGFSEYLNRFKCKEDPTCPCEPDKAETVEHVLLECPIYGVLRYELEQKLNIALRKENIYLIIRDNESRNVFIDYCINIGKKVICRNKNR